MKAGAEATVAARGVTGAAATEMVAVVVAEAEVTAAETTLKAKPRAIPEIMITTVTATVMAVAVAAKEAAANAAAVTVVAATAEEATKAEVNVAETVLKAKLRAIPEIMITKAAIAEAQMLLMAAGPLQMTMMTIISRSYRLHQPLPHNRPLHRLKDWFQVDLNFRETARLAANLCLPARRERRSIGGGNSGRG